MGERGEADAALAARPAACASRAQSRPTAPRTRPGLAAIVVHTSHKRQRLRDMRVLDRPPVPRQPGQHLRAAAEEAQLDKAGVAEQDARRRRRAARAERRSPGDKRRRGRPVFRARAMIARAEGDGDEAGGVAERQPAGEPDLDRLAARQMRAAAGWPARSRRHWRRPGRRGWNSVASAARGRWRMRPSAVDGEQLGRPAVGIVGGDHARHPGVARIAGRQRGEHRFDDFGGGVLRALQGRADRHREPPARAAAYPCRRDRSRGIARRRPWPPRPRSPSDGASAALLAP